jgi:hypothetical protein
MADDEGYLAIVMLQRTQSEAVRFQHCHGSPKIVQASLDFFAMLVF